MLSIKDFYLKRLDIFFKIAVTSFAVKLVFIYYIDIIDPVLSFIFSIVFVFSSIAYLYYLGFVVSYLKKSVALWVGLSIIIPFFAIYAYFKIKNDATITPVVVTNKQNKPYFQWKEKTSNKYQKIAVLVGACVIFFMLLFPPFEVQIRDIKINMGYSFILDPPQYQDRITASIKVTTLLIQWTGIVLLTAMVAFVLKPSPQSK